VYPDLVSDPPTHVDEQPYFDSTGDRLLVRFDGFIHNKGPGAFELRGSGPVSLQMTGVVQRVFNVDSSYSELDKSAIANVIYETNDDHQHWHFRHAARYSLWNDARTAEVAPASKVGFCLEDGQRIEPIGPTASFYTPQANVACEWGHTTAPSVYMGVSAGWRDTYGYQLALQWVDASDVVPGSYWVRDDVDPDGVVTEVDEVNPSGWSSVHAVIPGYLAQPVDAGEASGARPVDLATTKVGSPGASQLRIVEAPAHGQLNKTTNQWFSGAQVTYTPDSGYTGPDTFKYEARDSTSSFPLHPAQAAATLEVGAGPPTPTVAISGAPARMYTGTSVQLQASVTGGSSSHVNWSTDNGSISSSGLYTAPGSPPAGGAAHITATSDDGPSSTVGIGIDSPPKSRPSPIAKPAAPSRTNALSPLRALRHGRNLMVTVTSSRAGRLNLAVRRHGRRRLAWCAVRVQRLTPVTCRMRLPRAFASESRRRRLNVKAVLWVGKRTVAVRRLRVR
jgi:hypothetical protein